MLFVLPTFTSRRLSGAISLCRKRDGFFVAFALGHHGPRYSCDLVGECDRGDLRWPPGQQRCEPRPVLGAMDLDIADDRQCAGREQAAQIAIALFVIGGPGGFLGFIQFRQRARSSRSTRWHSVEFRYRGNVVNPRLLRAGGLSGMVEPWGGRPTRKGQRTPPPGLYPKTYSPIRYMRPWCLLRCSRWRTAVRQAAR